METNTRRIRSRLEREEWYLGRHGRNHDIYWHPTIKSQIQLPRHRTVSDRVARAIAKLAGWED